MYNQDMPYVLKLPRVNSVLPDAYWRMVTASLVTSNDVAAADIWRKIPCQTSIVHYGRLLHLDGGNTMRCSDLVSLKSGKRDTSFV